MKKIRILHPEPGYNLAAEKYDKKEKYLGSFEKGQFLPLLGEIAGQKILDVGAGTGRLVGEMERRGALVTALDVSPGMLKVLAKKHKHVKIMVGDAENIPSENGVYDMVVAAFLVVHLKDPARFFGEAHRILKDGGRFIFSNINQKEAPEIETEEGTIKIHSYYHRPERVREILRDMAFEIEKEVMVKEGDVWVNQIMVARK